MLRVCLRTKIDAKGDLIVTVLLYVAEAWMLLSSDEKGLGVLERSVLYRRHRIHNYCRTNELLPIVSSFRCMTPIEDTK